MIDETDLRQTESTEVCTECFGTGTKLDPVKGAMACPCRKSNRSKNLLTAARIPRRYADCSFSTFKFTPGTSLDHALLAAQRFVEEFPVDRGLLFTDPPELEKLI